MRGIIARVPLRYIVLIFVCLPFAGALSVCTIERNQSIQGERLRFPLEDRATLKDRLAVALQIQQPRRMVIGCMCR